VYGMSGHSYRNLAATVDRIKAAPVAAAAGHSYRNLASTLNALENPRPLLHLVPQPAAPRSNANDDEKFTTDPIEARRVAKILAVLFAQAAANAPITASIRAKLGITDEDVNAISEKIGRERAAEIMGLQWDGENLVPDPNAEKAITTTTENDVNETVDAAVTASAAPLEPGDTWAPGQGPNDTPVADTGLSDDEELALAIAALYVFSQYRPDAVADYETANSQNVMALTAYAAAGVTDVLVTDGELDDFPCIEANGQTWSIEQALANPLEHKNCQRQFWPLGADGMQLAAKRSRQIAPLPFTPNPEEGT
jgi:hypothetical protein